MATTQFRSAAPLLGTPLTWVSADDSQRLLAYRLYEDMYWNVPDTFKLVQRGTDTKPIYIPSPRIIVEATNRFLAKGFDFLVDPRVGTTADQQLIYQQITRLFKRELFWGKFATQRRYGLIRGDFIWHIVADDTKPEGSRISIYELDPGSYFPIFAEDSLDRIVGCHIVDQIKNGDDIVARRQTYRKTENGQISSELGLYEIASWDDRDPENEIKRISILVPEFILPPAITALPVYHIKNQRTPGDGFGSSELRGFEGLASAVNQAISDQELALALDGIGLYATTSGPPTDEDGNETNWILGPGRVAEIEPDTEFKRVSGVSSLPALDHVKFILGSMQQAAGVPDIAAGNVDVSIAESGIALYLQLAPILAKNAEKEQELLGVHDHMLYDLVQMWLPSYEAVPAGLQVDVTCTVEDPMPVNREARIQEILALATSTPPLISAEYARQELAKYGYDFPADMGETALAEQNAFAAANAIDPYASRVATEFGDTAQ